MTKSKKFIRIFIRILSGLLILAVLLSVLGIYSVRRSFPQVGGTLHVTGLHAGVDVYRDARGIPQIYAGDLHDLFFAQGYVHAQERFWQMDFWRHIGSGRLSELFGASEVKTDAFLRTMGWAAIAQQEWETSSPEDKAILQAYTDGVNTYLSGHQGAALSLEYAVLKLLNPHYVPEPWTPVNSLTWGKAMAWDLRGNIEEEIERVMLLKTLSLDQVNQLFPPYPSDHPLIVPGFSPAASASVAAGAPLASYPEAQLAAVQTNFSSLDPLLGPGGTGIGSNSRLRHHRSSQAGPPGRGVRGGRRPAAPGQGQGTGFGHDGGIRHQEGLPHLHPAPAGRPAGEMAEPGDRPPGSGLGSHRNDAPHSHGGG